MAMAIRVPSPALEYPDSDFDEDNNNNDDDHEDEMEAMAAVEAELRMRKKGQVIQHRHISPPLPSSSQPIDSPSRRAVEGGAILQLYEDILEVEVISSPPSTTQLSHDEEFRVISSETLQEKPTTPLTLGGSKFRRKQVVPTDISSPLVLHASDDLEIDANPLLDAQDSRPTTSTFDSIRSPPCFEHPEPMTSATSSRRSLTARTSSGKTIIISKKPPWKTVLKAQEQRAASRAQKEAYYGVDIHGLLDNIEGPTQQSTNKRYDGHISNPCKDLWTDKYRATKFIDLLGDERVHRDIMRWIKHWDFCVFGREIPKSSNHQSTYNNPKNPNKSTFGAALSADPYQRPQQRILMLHGPPGLGKTTLAHVAATLAGYEVLEINASDERSGTAARERIVEAVETIGIDRTGRRGKERCVILDECDGGDSNFVRVLLDLIHSDEKAGGPASKLTKGKKKRSRKPLLRPIICICNDLYATALRPLRPYCHILHIRPSPPSSLLPRLQKICHLENIKADARALTLLADSHEGDLRSCINSLQLLATRCDNLSLPFVQESLQKAKKEGSLSAHSVVEGVFARRTAKERRRLNMTGEIEGQRVVNDVNACGEFDRIMSECHTHFLTQSYMETHLKKTCEAYEWLNFYDNLHSALYQDQAGECIGYIPYCAHGFHELFAQEKNESQRTLERKRDSWEAFEKEKQNREIIDSWMSSLDGRMKQMFNRRVFAEEFISLVLRIISPNLKPVNEQLISPKEKLSLFRVVDAMIQTGLKYTQYKVDDGSFVFKLEPGGIENLIAFGTESKQIRGRYAVRQLVSREMERERIRRRKGGMKHFQMNADQDLAEVVESKGVKRGINQVEGEKKVVVERVKKDFFGRLIVEEQDEGKRRRTDPSSVLKIQPNVWVRFHEGYSNAVRKPVLFADLLGRV